MRNLTTRLVILLLPVLLIITGVNDYFRLVQERERLVQSARDDVRVFAETLALAVRQNVRRGRTTDELRDLLDELLNRPGMIGVAIYDPEEHVVAENVISEAPRMQADDLVRSAAATREAVSKLVEGPNGPILRYIQPFRWPGGRTATLEVRQTLGAVQEEFHRAIRDSILSRLVVLILFVLSIVALTRWSISRPIRALIAGAQAVGRGDLSQRIPGRRHDEIGQLADEFNRMGASLQAAHDALVRQAENRLSLEQEAQQTQKLAAVGMLAAEIAHEIGTPLNVISGRAEVLERTVGRDHPEHRHLEVILKQTERISGIIRALLDYTRPRRPTRRPEGLVPILGRVADLLLERCRRRGVRIELNLPIGLPSVQGDPDHLQQLFLNLLTNAVDACETGGTVRIATGAEATLPEEDRAGIVRGKVEAPHLAIHVIDSGKGLNAEQLDHVFEPFFSTKAQGHGTGLGLPIVEEIVRAHQGEIEMLSIPGRGTEVIVRLPLAPEAAAAAEASAQEPDSGERPHDA
jgi:two-component system NtrC family sensor kinase